MAQHHKNNHIVNTINTDLTHPIMDVKDLWKKWYYDFCKPIISKAMVDRQWFLDNKTKIERIFRATNERYIYQSLTEHERCQICKNKIGRLSDEDSRRKGIRFLRGVCNSCESEQFPYNIQ